MRNEDNHVKNRNDETSFISEVNDHLPAAQRRFDVAERDIYAFLRGLNKPFSISDIRKYKRLREEFSVSALDLSLGMTLVLAARLDRGFNKNSLRNDLADVRKIDRVRNEISFTQNRPREPISANGTEKNGLKLGEEEQLRHRRDGVYKAEENLVTFRKKCRPPHSPKQAKQLKILSQRLDSAFADLWVELCFILDKNEKSASLKGVSSMRHYECGG